MSLQPPFQLLTAAAKPRKTFLRANAVALRLVAKAAIRPPLRKARQREGIQLAPGTAWELYPVYRSPAHKGERGGASGVRS